MLQAFSDVSDVFIDPLFPACDDEVSLSVVFSEKPEGVLLRYDSPDGLSWQTDMSPSGLLNGAFLYSATVKVCDNGDVFRYFFIFFYDGKSWYYSRKGISRNCPPERDRFCLLPGFEAPMWVARSTCYQIFPDRFFNGDSSTGAREGEYSFDGGVVTTPSFDSVPKDFPASRCLDFYNGDLAGIGRKAGYLKALGIDTIYLNPVNASMTVHRYDAVDYFHVDSKLGGDKALAELSLLLHRQGIRLILDISINHTGSEALWYKKALADPSSDERSYYYFEDGRPRFWQGVKTLPQLNYNSKKLRSLVWEGKDSVLRKFLRDPFNIDGWRFDVAPEAGRSETDQLTREIWRGVRKSVKEENREAYIVAESWDDSASYLKGDMWDGIMNYYGAGRPVRSWMGERDRFLTSGWGHSPETESGWDAFELSAALNDALFSVPDQVRYFQLNLFDSHDTPRLHNNQAVMDRELYKGAVVILYLLPGMPSVYYGDEIQIPGRMGSVEGARYPMCWSEKDWDKDMLTFHVMLGRIRKKTFLGFSSTIIEALDEKALCIKRAGKGKAVLAVVNKGPERTLEVSGFLLPRSGPVPLYGTDSVLWQGEKILLTLKEKTSALVIFGESD